MALEVGKVRRLLGMVNAVVPSGNLDGTHAPALTSAYASLRGQIADSLEGAMRQEFEAFFPELDVVDPPSQHPRQVGLFPVRYASAAQGAATKIRLMGGWLEALLREHEADSD